jgi:hypothetical protein
VTDKLREDLTDRSTLPSGALLEGEEHIVVDRECGAHASDDVTSSDPTSLPISRGVRKAVRMGVSRPMTGTVTRTSRRPNRLGEVR